MRNSLAYDGSVYLAVHSDGASVTAQVLNRSGAVLASFAVETGGAYLGWQSIAGRAGSDPAFAVTYVRFDQVTNPRVMRLIRWRNGQAAISEPRTVADLHTEANGSEWGQVRWTGSEWAIAIRLRDGAEPRAVLVRMTDDGERELVNMTTGGTFANGQALAALPDGGVVGVGFLAGQAAYWHDRGTTIEIPNPNPALSVEDHQVVYRDHANDVLAYMWGGGVGFMAAKNGAVLGQDLAPAYAGGLAMAYSKAIGKTLVVAKTSAESTAVAFLVGDDGRPLLDDVLTIAPWDGFVPAFYQSLVAGPAGEFATMTHLSPQAGGPKVDIINASGDKLRFGAGSGPVDPPSGDLAPLIAVAQATGIPWGIVALVGIGVIFVAFSSKQK